jgi:hypothetical protein
MISDSLDRRFPGIERCGHTLQLFDELVLAKLLQLSGLSLNFSRELVRFGTNLRNCFLYIFGCLIE